MLSNQIQSLKRLDVISNNVANANTTGFKADIELFEQFLVKDKHDKTAFVADKATISNLEQSPIKTTYRALDVAINGSGFFIIKTPLGTRYSRNGNFQVSNDGLLVNNQGYPVLSADGGEIVFQDDDTDPVIGDDGTVFVKDEERGVIGVVNFENPKLLRKLGNGLFQSEASSFPDPNSKIIQGALEDSNVNSVTQIAKLIETQREINLATNLMNDVFSLERTTFRSYKTNGGN
jgi:flagellar basal-body rod protein FlgF